MKIHAAFKRVLLAVYCLLAVPAFAMDNINGTVRNESTGKPASGDVVVLLRLGEGMEEEARAKTDALGRFTFNVTSPKSDYVVRVLHQYVNYDQQVTITAPLELKVYDAVGRIPHLDGKMGIAQIESDGSTFRIIEMYAITNASTPPVTQFGPRNFEISLPAKAAFDLVQARGPGGVWVNVTPHSLDGLPGRYALNFPIRPGDTLFKYAYHLPCKEFTAFRLRLAYPIRNFAVIHPPSMLFKALRPGTFKSPGLVNGMQLEQSAAPPQSVEVPAFELSGVGTAKPSPASAVTTAPSVAAGSAAGGVQPASVNSGAVPDQSKAEFWVILAGILLTLMVTAAALRKSIFPPAALKLRRGKNSLLEKMKDELFVLEIERLRGSISAEEYDSGKQALAQNIQRIMAGSNQRSG